MKIQESAENYLETIFMLSQGGNRVRAVDVANELDYSKPSVSVAMKNLRGDGYIQIASDGTISLTDTGREIAGAMYERHVLVSDWLIFLGVDRKVAVHDACKMEHDISDESFQAIKKHVEAWRQEIYRQ